MKVLFTLLVSVLVCIFASAKERTNTEMTNIAKQVLSRFSNKQSRTADTPVTKYLTGRQFNVYGTLGQGFVVVSKDDDFSPILGYSDSDFTQDNMPCGFRWWISQLDKSLEVRKLNHEIYYPISFVTATSNNFIKTSWNQQAPYNHLCPMVDGKAAPTGCVATAMAQIMYYFKYPMSGKGKATYTVFDNDNNTSYDIDINSTYAWEKMKVRYLRPVDTDDAVATLMRDAGASSKMQYSAQSSGTSDFYAAKGFEDNFRYDSLAIKRYARNFYSDEEWMEIVSSELEEQRPILYCGQDPIDGGHAFILDGINENGLVHVNWGWSGSGNGWYDINVLKPTSYGGSGLGEGEGFNDSQSMVFGFKCQETPDPNEENFSLWVTDSCEFLVEENKLYLCLTDLYNLNCRYFDGTVDVVLEDVGNSNNRQLSNIIDTNGSDDNEPIAPGYGYLFADDNDNPREYDLSEDFSSIKAGNYKLYIGSKSESESAYKIVRGNGGPVGFDLSVAEDGTMTITKSGNTTGISKIEYQSVAKKTHIYDLSGKELPQSNSSLHGIMIVKQGKITRKIIR